MVSANTRGRRTFLASVVAGTLAATGPATAQPPATPLPVPRKNPLCAFVKFLQTLDNETLARTIAKLGFDGIEATIRDKGQVLPEQVVGELPKLVEALTKHGLEITIMASSVNRVDQPHTENVLRTAASLGVKKYRMAYYRYDRHRPVISQLDSIKPALLELAALNRELGMTAVYQNHSGSRIVGASVWDLRYLLQDIDPQDVGVAFDIRHATVEGGLAWPVDFGVIRPHLGAVYVKDFVWDGRRPKNVPLGQGRIDPAFFPLLRNSKYSGPISLHVEYLPDAGNQENVVALKSDLAALRSLLTGKSEVPR
jgi:sugar phosphate isomerase/epimerase